MWFFQLLFGLLSKSDRELRIRFKKEGVWEVKLVEITSPDPRKWIFHQVNISHRELQAMMDDKFTLCQFIEKQMQIADFKVTNYKGPTNGP